MDKNPFDFAIEQFIREDSQLLLSSSSLSPSGSESNSESHLQDQAVPIFRTGSSGGNDVMMEVSNEVVISSSANSVLNSMLDMKPTDDYQYRPIEAALKKNEPEVGDCTNNNTIHMLLNFDKTKYTAIPVMDSVENRTIFTPTTTTTATLNPITIIGYNCYSLLPIITTTQPITCLSSATPVESNNNDFTTATLKCDEKLLPSSNENTRDNSDLSDNGKSNNSSNINHHGSYGCTMCNNKFFTREYLQYHLMKDHGLNKVPPASSSQNNNTNPTTSVASTSTDRLFRCSLCSKTYSYLRNLKKHELTVHSPANQDNVQKTQKRRNDAEEEERKSSEEEHCRVCHVKFSDKGSLMIHMKAHTSTCQVCYKIFGSKRGLKLHSVIHYGNTGKQFGCTICDKRYSHSRSLKHHLKSHWNEVKTTATPEASVALSVQFEEHNQCGNQSSPPLAITDSIETVKEASPMKNNDDDDPKADFDAFGFGTIESTLD